MSSFFLISLWGSVVINVMFMLLGVVGRRSIKEEGADE